MNKLEERLQHIRKIDITDVDVMRGKRAIEGKLHAKPTSWIPAIITACMFAVLAFLIFVPQQQNKPEQLAVVEEMVIKDFNVLNNHRPNNDLNVNSFLYIARTHVEDPIYTEEMKTLLSQIMIKPLPWNGKVDLSSVDETVINFIDGTSLHLKIDYGVIYDVTNQVKYEIEDVELSRRLSSLIFSVKYELEDNLYIKILAVILVIGIIHIIFDLWYRKRYNELDANGKRKRIPLWLHFIMYIIFIFPMIIMQYILGSIHLGWVMISLALYVIIYSQLEIKLGIVRPNNIHFKVLLPSYLFALIIAIIVNLVV